MTSNVLRKLLIARPSVTARELPFEHSGLFTAGIKMRIPFFHLRKRNAGLDTIAHSGEITIRVVSASSQSTVTVIGRVTVDSSPHLRYVLLQSLRRGTGPVLVIDLFGVSYLDMSGLATLLEALKAAFQRSVKLRVLGMRGQSKMLAEVAELDKVFQTAGSEVEFR